MSDPAFKNLIWYLIAGSRGGETRGRIISAIKKKPCNLNQLSKKLKLDYKSVQHHIKILEKHNLIYSQGDYGAVFFITETFNQEISSFEEIWERFGN
jgi:predicted transcriptional regulator